MSLNDYFAANGAMYLRPVGLPDCFPLPGLPHGCKPPPLTMQHPCNPPQKPRTMAAVSPLHQVVPPQPNLASYEGNSLSFNAASRTSSFAAALRKLAKQAVDPVSGEKDLTQISPVSSPVLNQGSLTPKRNIPNPPPPPMFLSSHQVSYTSSSPPVVTIAPSRPVATHTSDSRKVMDLSNVTQGSGSSALSNGSIQDPLSMKLDSTKTVPRPAHGGKWEEHSLSNKSLSASSGSSQVRPHATIAPLPRPDDSLTSSRGFQPYRGSEETRNTLPHHISLFDHHHPAASYPYTPAFLPPPHLAHPAYRFDDPLYLERYSLLRPPVMPYPPQAGIMAPPTAFYPNNRYAADLIAQSLSLNSANNIVSHERLKQEEERRLREKELELDHSRTKEQERQREKEHKEKENREREQKEREQREKEKREREKSLKEKEEKVDYSEHKKSSSNSSHSSHSKRTESPNVRSGPVIQCMPNNTSPATTISNSAPLNLIVHPSLEPPKKESELWMPWQQPVNHHGKDNQEPAANTKHPTFRPQDNQRPKESHIPEKVNLRFSPSILNEKKQSNATAVNPPENEARKSLSESKKFDSIHHHINELSNKDHGTHEWRHEKLQKACTNSHRKSHESKKAKEDRGNTVYPNYHRKVMNGVIIKASQYQNEGMHARILENEKSRLEINGHLLPKAPAENHVNERLIVPSYKTNYIQNFGKEISPQKTFVENYNAPVLRSNIDLAPVVSKLDKEAKDLRRNGLKVLEDDEKEELRLRNFLIITKGPPLKFESNVQKIKFLKLFGLTTHYKRKKIELDLYLKRRKILMEDSNIPPYLPKEESLKNEFTPIRESTNAEILAEKLRSETTPEKVEFLLKIGLSPITLVKKEERERIRQIVEDEKLRRHYRMMAKNNKKASPRRLFVPKSEEAQKLEQVRKIKEKNNAVNGFVSKKLMDEDEQMFDVNLSSSSQTFAQKNGQVPYLSPETSNSFLPPATPIKSHLEVSQSSEGNRAMQCKSFNKYSFKRGHSLKHEWRGSAPKLASQINHTITQNGHATGNERVKNVSVSDSSTQVDSSLISRDYENKYLTSFKNSFHWPGLEAVMEAFYKHQNEQVCEKSILTERYHHLRKTQEDLKREADALSKHMSELLKCKRELDDERQKRQQVFDHLKQCLHPGRLQHGGVENCNH